MSEETTDDSKNEPGPPSEDAPGLAAEAEKEAKPKKKKKRKKADYQTKVRILMGAIAVAVVAFIFCFVHWLQVVQDASNPNSENARLGGLYPHVSKEEIEADERRFPLHPTPVPSSDRSR